MDSTISTVILILLVSVCISYVSAESKPCILERKSYGQVCVCNSTYCDTIEVINPGEQGSFVVVSSSKGGLRFQQIQGYLRESENSVRQREYVISRPRKRTIRPFLSDNSNDTIRVVIDSTVTYQKIVGFGGALTGSVSLLLNQLPNGLKNFVYDSYYSATTGIGYTMMRLPIGGSDFDLEPWAYNELPENDQLLSNFTTIDRRDLEKIEHIDNIKERTGNSGLKLIGAAWSPPKWMKNNNAWSGFSYLKSKFYQTWADYHIRFLELFASKNTSFWALSTGNEPLNGVIGWVFVHFMSLGWTPYEQGKWVGENLGPTISKSRFSSVKLFGADDQRYTFPWWFKQMNVGNQNATSYLNGLAVHWYWDELVPPILLDDAHRDFPDKIILLTESCVGDKPWQTHGPELGSWSRAEQYINKYFQNLEHWVSGWIDWNLLLNELGGPTYINNTVDSAVIVNTTTWGEIYKQPIFYGIGHFSKFIVPDSVRIDVTSSDNNLLAIGFSRPDSTNVIIFYNKNNRRVKMHVEDSKVGSIDFDLPPKSIHSFIYKT